jgi:signal transduction histidine kinase
VSVAGRHVRHHALAVLFVLLAFAATVGLQAIAGRSYFILYISAVIFATWFGGLSAGLTASVAAVLLSVLFQLPEGAPVAEFEWIIVLAVVTIATSTLVARRRRAEERLATLLAQEQARRGEAESLSAQKTHLLAQVAHELRQPLGAIVTATRLATEPDTTAAAKDRAMSVITQQSGEIHVGVEQGPNEVVIRVRDTGRGIPPEGLSTIFDMFQTGTGEGTGLGVGLAVVKGLTEMHGGSVRAISKGIGHGSEFVVTLPANVRPAA